MKLPTNTVADLAAEIQDLRRQLKETQTALNESRRGPLNELPSDRCGEGHGPFGTERFAALVLDQTQDAIVVCDASGRVIRANQAADQLCGESPLLQQFDSVFPLRRVIHAAGDAELLLFPPACTAPFLRDVEAALVRKDGLRVELLVNVGQMVDGDGTPLGTLVTMTDITDRKHVEDALRRAKEDWEQTFDTVPDLVAILDNEHRVVRANRAMAERLKLSPTECAGRFCYEMLHGLTQPPDSCPHAKTCRNGKEHTAELEEPLLGGHFLVSTTPRFDEHDNVIGAVHVARDITDLKRREKQVETLTRMYAVLSQVNEAIVRIDETDALFAEVCRIIAEIGQLPLAWVGLRKGREVVPAAFCGRAAGILSEIRVEVDGELGAGPTGTCIRENRAVINDDFFTNPVMKPWRELAARYGVRTSAGFPLRRQGEAIGNLTIYAADPNAFDAEQIALLESLSANISYAIDAIDHERRRVQIEESLRKLADELARSNQDLEQFASVASHDLQEPLRTVVGFVELLRRKYVQRLDTEANEFIDFIVDGTKRMQTLIRDLLEYSRVTTRRREPIAVNAADSLRRALDNLHESIQQAGAEVTYCELPTVRADPSQLSQLFQNLLINAMKFRTQEPPRVRIEAARDGDQWRFSVQDNGIGIEPKYHEQIFEVFRRLHTRERYEGTGIGLAICKKIVDRHGGRIWVDSQLGQGATFHFTLPG